MVSVLLASIIRFDSCTTCVHVSMAIIVTSLLSVVQKLMPLVGFCRIENNHTLIFNVSKHLEAIVKQ